MNLRNEYFTWMMLKIFGSDYELFMRYYGLLVVLDSVSFVWTIPLDANRQQDAQDLRYIFGDEHGISQAQICQELDISLPSLLEVIVALINRGQENILYDPDSHSNINEMIFMDILENLDLSDLTGSSLNAAELARVENSMYILFNHEYSYNGVGGLFAVNNPKDDMRETEIWYQFMWYLNEKLGGKYVCLTS